MIHEFVREKIPAYAIGALDPSEAPDVERHLRECERCTERALGYAHLGGALAISAPDAPLPPGFSARLLEKAAPSRSVPTPVVIPRPRSAPSRRVSPARLPWALAAACLLLALLAGGRSLQLDRQVAARDARLAQFERQTAQFTELGRRTTAFLTAPGVRGVDLRSGAPSARGRLYVAKDGRRALLWCRGMPALRPNEVYHVWVGGPGGTPKHAGAFELWPDRSYYHFVDLADAPGGARLLAVTRGPATGTTRPASPPVMAGTF